MCRVVKLETPHSRSRQPVRKHGELFQGLEFEFTVCRCSGSRDIWTLVGQSTNLGNFGDQLDQLGQKTWRSQVKELRVEAEIQRLDGTI
jgi:hypothetical protein